METLIPWSLRGLGPFLNSYGDALFFRAIRRTPPIRTNPEAETGIHSIVPHRNINAYLLAVKSFLRHCENAAIFVHDDGSLTEADEQLIRKHLPGATILSKHFADEQFEHNLRDPFLSLVRSSYTSYLKLFDPTFLAHRKRIMLLDTDTLFLQRPEEVIRWLHSGGRPWYHLAPRGNMRGKTTTARATKNKAEQHIQTKILKNLDPLNAALGTQYRMEQGFCAGFVGYDHGLFDKTELKQLLETLYARFSDGIFQWGSEQTIHGLLLCGHSAKPLPPREYCVLTRANAAGVSSAKFVHFVGETRYHRFHYPRFGGRIIRKLRLGTR